MRVGLKIVILALSLCATSFTRSEKRLIDYVNPFIGTDGTGHTYPGASLPFGMVQLSPDTRTSGWENCSGYHASNPTIIGFSHTHLSGTGAMDLGDVLLMPTTGPLQTAAGDEARPETGYRSAFRHETERASPGFYSVLLDDHGIRVDLTVTERAGFHRYVFHRSEEAHIIIDLLHGLGDQVIDSSIEIIGQNEVAGFRRSKGWAADQRVYFVAEVSKPFRSFGTGTGETRREGHRKASGRSVKAYLDFSVKENEAVLVKVGISAVSIEGARANLRSEIPDWDFEQVRREAGEKWERTLGRIKVEGASDDEKTVFYTALYHSMLIPNIFTDVDGHYRGADGRVRRSKDRPIYTVFSLWDTFRATHPLFTIIDPRLANDLVATLLVKYEEGGLLPVWELVGNETNTMIGYHSVPVIADAFVKGIRGFDADKAFEAMKRSADQDAGGLKHYRSRGYVPSDAESEAVSKTLEYAYDDWCIAQMARELGRADDYHRFMRRAAAYRNVYDASSGFMRGRKIGNWVEPFDPFEVSGMYTEANAWQYLFFAPHDVEGLIELMGGEAEFIKRLDALFTASPALKGRLQPDISGMIGQYAHGNEPSHHVAYLYNYAGAPWKTQERVRQIMDTLYSNSRDGLSGNDDCGQMSSWYNFSAMGFYPVCPGQGIYAIGTPMFERVTIDVGAGRIFTIRAKRVSRENRYIQSATLNGKPYTRSYISHTDIMSGGELVFEMGNRPNYGWGASKRDRPSSSIEKKVVMTPFFVAGQKAFVDSMSIEIGCHTEAARIHYTLDGSAPTRGSKLYSGPITLTATTTVRAIAIKDGMEDSFVESVEYIKIPYTRSITYRNPYSHLYTAGGANGLLDYVRGEAGSFGAWQGFEGADLDAVIDLGESREIKRISAGFLQNYHSWIFLPSSVEYLVSDDGKEFRSLGVIANTVPPDRAGAFIKEFEKRTGRLRARYVKVIARNLGVCPDWHPGAGHKCWVFVDEIVIE